MDERITIKKRLALYPDVREEVCRHMHFSWSGSVPNTGLLKCSMCGYTSDEIQDIESGRKTEETVRRFALRRSVEFGF